MYGVSWEVGRIVVTSHFDTLELLTRYHDDDDLGARERAIELNLPLVRALARRFSRSPEQTDDLVQAGSIGLIKAVDGFKPARGRNLGAYAVPTIVGELRRHQERRTRSAGPESGGAVVTTLVEETAEAAVGESDLRRSETRVVLRDAFRGLTRRERQVVALRFYRDLTQQGIAEELGLSQAQVSRTLSDALAKLRRALVAP